MDGEWGVRTACFADPDGHVLGDRPVVVLSSSTPLAGPPIRATPSA